MFKKPLLTLLLSIFAAASNAHEIWLERDGAGPVRVYFGEPADANPDHGGDEMKSLKTPQVFTSDRNQHASLIRKNDHLEAAVTGTGDARLFDDQVWKPWKNKQGEYQAVIFQARAGRGETRAVLDYELVPATANGNTFVATFKGQPLPGKRVKVITPGKWEKTFKADAAGRIEVPVNEKGRFILVSQHEAATDQEIAGQKVSKLSYIATLSFVAE